MNTVAASESPSGKPAPAQSPTGRAPTDRPTAGRVLAGRTSTGRAPTGRAPARRAPAASLLDAPQVVPGPDGVREMTTRQLGQAGEELAAERLAAAGWQIVERNLRLRQGELDIIALDGTTLVFLEVKTRRTVVTGVPQAAVTGEKLRRLRRLAGEYLMEYSTPHRDVRIDVIGLHVHLDGTVALEHLRGVS